MLAVFFCAATRRKLYDRIATRVCIPFFQIAHAMAADRLTRVGLLAKRLTVFKDFYTTRLREGFGIDVILPNERQIGQIDDAVFNELCRSIVEDCSRDFGLEIIDGLTARGAKGIILGCNEIEMMVKPTKHHVLPLYNTTLLHASHAVEWALSGG